MVAELPETVSEERGVLSLTPTISLSAPSQNAIDIVQFHPTTSSIILTVQGPTLQVWDTSRQNADAAFKTTGSTKGYSSASWSKDGRLIQTAAKDGTVGLWDIRANSEEAAIVRRSFKKSA